MGLELNYKHPAIANRVEIALQASEEPGDIPLELNANEPCIRVDAERCFDDEP
jgi:hypothetical protein